MPLPGETLKLIVTNGRVIFSDVEVPDQHAVPVYGFPCVVGHRLRSASRRSDREVVCEYACRGRTHVAGWAANMLLSVTLLFPENMPHIASLFRVRFWKEMICKLSSIVMGQETAESGARSGQTFWQQRILVGTEVTPSIGSKWKAWAGGDSS